MNYGLRIASVTLATLTAAVAFFGEPRVAGKQKPHDKVLVMAVPKDGSPEYAVGEVKFDLVASTLDVSVDIATSYANSEVTVFDVQTDPLGVLIYPPARLIVTDSKGVLKWDESYGVQAESLTSFSAQFSLSIENSSVFFVSEWTVVTVK